MRLSRPQPPAMTVAAAAAPAAAARSVLQMAGSGSGAKQQLWHPQSLSGSRACSAAANEARLR
eukprot:765768-Pelagomonas_calceolata.AAC.10